MKLSILKKRRLCTALVCSGIAIIFAGVGIFVSPGFIVLAFLMALAGELALKLAEETYP